MGWSGFGSPRRAQGEAESGGFNGGQAGRMLQDLLHTHTHTRAHAHTNTCTMKPNTHTYTDLVSWSSTLAQPFWSTLFPIIKKKPTVLCSLWRDTWNSVTIDRWRPSLSIHSVITDANDGSIGNPLEHGLCVKAVPFSALHHPGIVALPTLDSWASLGHWFPFI